ncbi:MAG: 30S ribosomal protein S11 [Candidatus Chisholmbacteria bacterium]|nr:30S ribosomal protein S11 [Candidatus Chisholmbacteria bacterium]
MPAKTKTTKQVTKGKMYVTATFNNTLVTVTDETGGAVAWGSTGKAGFKGSRKSTPYAATTAVEGVLSDVKNFGLKELEVYIKGPGPGRDAALRVLRNSGIKITLIADVTPIPHNGSRPRKRRRS